MANKRNFFSFTSTKMFKRLLLLSLLMVSPLLAEVGYIEPWGKDASLIPHKTQVPPPPKTHGIFSKLAEQVILFHQNVISPISGPRSHFRPTSSRYMHLSMRRHGFIKGFVMGCDRLLRENKEEWVYRTITIDGNTYKWDPTY